VVFQDDLMQLIQYTPATETVLQRPLLILPPWINKFYILDLRPRNSLVRYLVSQGHTVFMVSWVNPDEQLAGLEFEDYMKSGIFAALDAIEQATGEKEVNASATASAARCWPPHSAGWPNTATTHQIGPRSLSP